MIKPNLLQNIKKALSALAEKCNFTEDQLAVDYSLDLDDELYDELRKLALISQALQKALADGDMIAVKAALILSRIYTMNLRNFFSDIFDDIESIGWSNNYSWPEIPEGYQLPEKYLPS
ncbi:hypothetical protein EFZ10_05430 [Tatumella sp. TA1]|uniref:hypothetical protein n=1 Tax=Rosenbergiella collisarenosi TaxID=1544695 RepID=UPI0008F8CA32|nr:hypothetical protein [Rosenbergiella collisarenosi]MBT0722822.1 hypothetical protein [Rosenbergiella collisarenosi]QGX91119.1 hypothetical protein EFZ10_05430 [Tatumella sp. TA1]